MTRVNFFIRKTLDKNFVNAIKNRSLSIEQLDHYYEHLVNEKNQHLLNLLLLVLLFL